MIWIIALILIASLCSAEELPPMDFSEYEVGKIYKNSDDSLFMVDAISQDKRGMTSHWVVLPLKTELTYQEEYYKRVLKR